MLFIMLIGVVLVLVLLFNCTPKIEVVTSGTKYIVLLWYNTYDTWEDKWERKYVKLFEF